MVNRSPVLPRSAQGMLGSSLWAAVGTPLTPWGQGGIPEMSWAHPKRSPVGSEEWGLLKVT